MMRLFAALVLMAGSFAATAASAVTIEKIVSPSGIQAWLVRDPAVPLVSLNYSFHGGSSQDSAEKSGTANLAGDLLDEGAGDLDGQTFHERLENHAIELSFRAGRDEFHGSLRSLSEHREDPHVPGAPGAEGDVPHVHGSAAALPQGGFDAVRNLPVESGARKQRRVVFAGRERE